MIGITELKMKELMEKHGIAETTMQELLASLHFATITKEAYATDFGGALNALRDGHAVQRKGWNGKGQFIYHVPSNDYPAVTEVAKKHIGDQVPYNAYLAIKSVQGTVAPWAPSQTDVLAQDWQIFNENEVAESIPFGAVSNGLIQE